MTNPIANPSANPKADSKAPSTLGKTWSDLAGLNIDIDFMASNNLSAQKPTAPSLNQLQSQRQNSSLVLPTQPQKNSSGEIGTSQITINRTQVTFAKKLKQMPFFLLRYRVWS